MSYSKLVEQSPVSKGAAAPLTGNDEILTLEEVAKLLRVHPSTIHQKVKDGYLPVLRVGRRAIRFRLADVSAALTRDLAQGEATKG